MMRVIVAGVPSLASWATTKGTVLSASNMPTEQSISNMFLPILWSGKQAAKTFLTVGSATTMLQAVVILFVSKISHSLQFARQTTN